MKMDAWKSISISIHTLHTEGDTLTIHYMDDTDISIHTLHTEGDRAVRAVHVQAVIFQSTPSTRRVTLPCVAMTQLRLFQSTPSTRRVTRLETEISTFIIISIHTLHTEGDLRVMPLLWVAA